MSDLQEVAQQGWLGLHRSPGPYSVKTAIPAGPLISMSSARNFLPLSSDEHCSSALGKTCPCTNNPGPLREGSWEGFPRAITFYLAGIKQALTGENQSDCHQP